MKKLVSRITIALFLTLYACYPVHAGVGDVYYCVPDNLIVYNQNTKKASLEQTSKFKFKWIKKYDEDYLEFDDNFIIGNYSLSNISVGGDEKFSATTIPYDSDLLSFYEGRFQWSAFHQAKQIKSLTLYATCSKF